MNAALNATTIQPKAGKKAKRKAGRKMSAPAKLECPKCGGLSIVRERRMNGNTMCYGCGLSLPHNQWDDALVNKQEQGAGTTDIEKVLSAELRAERRRNETLQDEIFKLLSEKRELKVKLEKLLENNRIKSLTP
jgi:transcription elongation factor Elf1